VFYQGTIFVRCILNDDSTALVAIQERNVDFHGDEIHATLVEIEGTKQIYVPLRPICKYLGLSWPGQFERINRDPVLRQETRTVRVTRTVQAGDPEVLCLPLDFLNGWLFGVNANRVKPVLRDKIIQYQRDCYRVLAQAFQTDELVTTAEEEQNVPTSLATLKQIREMGLAIAHMAEQQIEIEQRLNTRLDRAAVVVGNINRRLSVVERRLSPPEYVTDEMATNIALAVKALAEELSRHDPGKNHYQSVYMEIYRRFRAPSYDRIRIDRYEAVMKFLDDWQKSIDKHSQPDLFDDSAEPKT
jgi:hypothetical protein